jgi:hypothetical protein
MVKLYPGKHLIIQLVVEPQAFLINNAKRKEEKKHIKE